MRDTTTRRAAIDIEDFERRLRGPSADRAAPGVDPLSELARLIQGDEAREPTRRIDRLFADEGGQPASRRYAAPQDEDALAAELRGAFDDGHALNDSHAFHDSHAPGNYEHYVDAPTHQTDYAAPAHEAYYAERAGHVAHDAVTDPYEDDAAYLDYAAEAPQPAPAGRFGAVAALRSRFRPWHAVTALSLIGVSVIGYGFAHRAGAVGSREIAVIAAPTGPVKVAPPVVSAEQAPARADSAVLDRQEQAPVKGVASHQEQAAEPTVAPPPAPSPIIGGSPPKRVKTVSVRPDGSLIDSPEPPPAVVRATEPETAQKPAAPVTTPKTAVKPPVTSGKPAKVAHAAEKPKPAPAAVSDDASEAAAPKSTHAAEKGAFAVQFGAANSEAEARALMTRIVRKYSAKLGGRRPTFKIAKVGDKTVYRVRVHDVSKEAATRVCGEVRAGGDNCFVAGAN